MPDETKRIEATHGPYAGSQIDIPTADADAAIADGWARDPFATPDPNAPPPPEWTQEAHDKSLLAAEKAARKLRGEPEPEDAMKAKTATDPKKPKADDDKADDDATKAAAMQAADTSGKGYETRAARTPKAGS